MKKIIITLVVVAAMGVTEAIACSHTWDGSDCDDCKKSTWCDRNVKPALETVGTVGGAVLGGAAATAAASTGAGAVVSGGLIAGGAAAGNYAGRALGEYFCDKDEK